MGDGIHFNLKNNYNARFINTQMQSLKPSIQEAMPNMQSVALKNVNGFITDSARNLYQFFANMQASQMQGCEMSLIVKDLLNMHKDMQSFLAMMTDNPTQISKPDLAQLLMSSKMDLSKMSAFMQENGKEALSKLFTMTTNFAQTGGVSRNSQIGEMIAILNACTPNSDTSQVQVLKNVMLLYLPWLPIGEQNFSINIGKSSGDGEDIKEEDSVSILISTVNFGNVSVLIFQSERSTINFNISAGDDFPKEKILAELKAEASDYNVQTSMLFEKKENLTNRSKPNVVETKVSVNTSRHVNPFLILMAQSAVRIIIETDKNFSLLESRREKL